MVHLKNCKWLGTHNPVYPTNHCVLSHGSFLLSKWDANPSMCCYFKMVYLSKPFHGGFQPYNYFIIRGSGNKKIWFSQPFPQDSWSNKNYGEVSTSMLLLVCYLVGGWATPLKIWKSDWDDYSQYILENIKCLKPPTRNCLNQIKAYPASPICWQGKNCYQCFANILECDSYIYDQQIYSQNKKTTK